MDLGGKNNYHQVTTDYSDNQESLKIANMYLLEITAVKNTRKIKIGSFAMPKITGAYKKARIKYVNEPELQFHA